MNMNCLEFVEEVIVETVLLCSSDWPRICNPPAIGSKVWIPSWVVVITYLVLFGTGESVHDLCEGTEGHLSEAGEASIHIPEQNIWEGTETKEFVLSNENLTH